MVMGGAVIEKLFTSGVGWFEGCSSSSCWSSPTSPLDLKLVMSRVHNPSSDEAVSSRVGLGSDGCLQTLRTELAHSPFLLSKMVEDDTTSVWTKFKVPLGRNLTVSMDLKGFGKGHAWVNGKSLSKYWPISNIAHDSNCLDKACDYHDKYDNTKCVRLCGIPTHKWYHLPPSYLVEGENEMVLFEEFGGSHPCSNSKQ
ncbi:beta-galactosidase 15 [Tanacetum coccineum]